jgi:hypothetical protein
MLADDKEPMYWAIVKFSVPTRQDAEFVCHRISEYVDSDSLQDQQETAVHDVLLIEQLSAG